MTTPSLSIWFLEDLIFLKYPKSYLKALHVLTSYMGKLEAKIKGWELMHKAVVLCISVKGGACGSHFQT